MHFTCSLFEQKSGFVFLLYFQSFTIFFGHICHPYMFQIIKQMVLLDKDNLSK